MSTSEAEVTDVVAKKEHWGEIEIPEGIDVKVDKGIVEVRGSLGTVVKDLSKVPIDIFVEDKKIRFRIYMKGKKGASLINTISSKFRNLFIGVEKGYTYKMKVFYIHFPITVEVSGDEVLIKNFTGERGYRRAKIMPGVNVKVKKRGTESEIILTGMDKDAISQTAANIYLSCKIKRKDPRVFLDGIYLYYKGVGIEDA
jgi:large subunit ribosomal protein L6